MTNSDVFFISVDSGNLDKSELEFAEEIMTYADKCKKWFDANSNGKESIRVRISKRVDACGDTGGWDNDWVDTMDEYIGRTVDIKYSALDNNQGFKVDQIGHEGYWFPFECFEVIGASENVVSDRRTVSVVGREFLDGAVFQEIFIEELITCGIDPGTAYNICFNIAEIAEADRAARKKANIILNALDKNE